MRLSGLFLGASMLAIALPALAQTAPRSAAPAAVPVQTGPVTTLRDALVTAYNTSPELAGERANLRATDAGVPIARSAGLPGVNANAGF